MQFNEDLIHFIWKHKLLLHQGLETTSGEKITVINTGTHNVHDGPDFLNAKIQIADTVWAGNVEIHLNTSDWLAHNHTANPKYQNVILHVVYNHDLQLSSDMVLNRIPVLELKTYLPSLLLKRYTELNAGNHAIHCHQFWPEAIHQAKLKLWLERLVIERLEQRSQLFKEVFVKCNQDFEHTFMAILFRAFGIKGNEEAFLQLALKLKPKHLYKSVHQMSIEALLFGVSGFISHKSNDAYIIALQHEWKHLKELYRLDEMSKSTWNFKGIRPANFPTVRIAQLCTLLANPQPIYTMILNEQIEDFVNALRNAEPAPYWHTHFRPDRLSSSKPKAPGQDFIDRILINVVVPFLFFLNQQKGQYEHAEDAALHLNQIKAEKNNITSQWLSLGFESKNAAQSQALTQLFKFYCVNKKCLSCQIGNEILRKK